MALLSGSTEEGVDRGKWAVFALNIPALVKTS